ncbi:MAG: hypothetical protein ABEJ74_04710 [Haloferacaceae archaeon]
MRCAALALALLAVLALPAGPAVASAGAGVASPPTGLAVGQSLESPPAQVAGGYAQQEQPAGEWVGETDIVVSLRGDRDARWHVETRYDLETENETAAFRRYGDAFEAGEASGAISADVFRRLANTSAETAGRPMAVRNVSRSARVEGDEGVLVLSFTWTNFLEQRSDSDLLVLRDAFVLPGGRTWLATLQPDQELVVQTPPGYTLNYSSVPVQPVSGSVVIEGPRELSPEEPLTLRYQPATATEQLPWELIVGGVVALAVVALVLLRRRGPAGDSDGGAPGGDDGGPTGGDSGPAAGAAAETTEAQGRNGEYDGTVGESDAGTVAGGGTNGAAEAGAAGAEAAGEASADEAAGEATAGDDAEVDLSLLSDEERVEHLLEGRGGRMRQAKIVEETGWSDAKVSQLLSAMDDEGRIEKLRIGRENLISLPGTDLTAGNGSRDDNDGGEDASERGEDGSGSGGDAADDGAMDGANDGASDADTDADR